MSPRLEKTKHGISLNQLSQSWWHMLVINEVKRMRQEDYKFKASLGYTWPGASGSLL
jgi:hypothetical protein